MHSIDKVAIIGMGALGVLYGDIITRSLGSDSVYFVADEKRIERYKKEGVYANGKACTFSYINPDSVKEDDKPDLIIFAVKATALDDAIEEVKKIVRDDTIIVSVLNGISSEDTIKEKLESKHIIHCVAQGMDAVKLGNKLTYGHEGELRIGIPKDEQTDERLADLKAFTKFMDRAHMSYTIEEDIKRRLWGKWMLNVGVNQVVMVYEGTYATIQKDGPARDMMIAAMREVLMLAKAEHVDIGEEDLDGYVKLMDTLSPDGMPSMRQDGLMGRKTEVELFAGTVIRKAEADHVEVPVNKELYKMVRKLEGDM